MDKESAAHWPERAELYFIDLCLEEVKRRMGPSQFEKKNLSRIELAMVEKFGSAYKEDRLKKKWHRLKSATKTFQGLIEATGFGWNSDANTVTADEEVWDAYIQKYPDAKRFKKKGLANYDKLREIFVGKSATGVMAMGSLEIVAAGKASASARMKEKVMNVSGSASALNVEEIGDSSDEVLEVEKKKTIEKSSAKKRKSPMSRKGGWQEAMESQTDNERYTSDRLISYLEEKEARKISTNADSMCKDEVLLKQCVEKLQKHEEYLTNEQFSGFMMELVRSKDLRIAFMMLADNLTLRFLLGVRID